MKPQTSLTATPLGLRDLLPAEVRKRRQLEASIRGAFEKRGFGEVICPTFEFYDLLSVEASTAVKQDMVRFIGSDGRILALRPEMTTAIARLAVKKLDLGQGPYPFYYIANVFREEFSREGLVREIRQAGVELIGRGGVEEDTDIIALFIETLKATGLSDIQVGLGQIGFLESVLRALPVSEAERSELRAAMAARSLVKYEKALSRIDLKNGLTEKLLKLPTARGDKEALENAEALVVNSTVETELKRLIDVYSGLCERGLDGCVSIDFGIWHDFNYYTGLGFEAYAPGIGRPLGGGGRYDNLLAELGKPAPAAGFAIDLKDLQALTARSDRNENGGSDE